MSRSRLALCAAVVVALTVSSISPAFSAIAPIGATTIESVSPTGSFGDADSSSPAISGDGRYLAFTSKSSNLVAGDTNGENDIFLRDRETGSVSRISLGVDGSEPSYGSYSPSISSDGRRIVFISRADNLVADDSNDVDDVFLWNADTGRISRINLTADGRQVTGGFTTEAVLSKDGRSVVFTSTADDLVNGDSGNTNDVFVRNLETATTSQVNVSSEGTAANVSDSFQYPAISESGRFVAFSSRADNLVPGDTNTVSDVFLHDTHTGSTSRVNVSSRGAQSEEGSSYQPSISADGRYVVYASAATNLVAGDDNDQVDVFLRDRVSGTTSRISVSSSGTPTEGGPSAEPVFSANGSFVAFISSASGLVSGDTNNRYDVFIRDLANRTTSRASVSSSGTQGLNGDSFEPALSDDGRYVAFSSRATGLVDGDGDLSDVFVRHVMGRAPAIVEQPASVRIEAGQGITFRTGAIGDEAPSIRWQSSPGGSPIPTWTDVPDATAPTLTLATVPLALDGTTFRAIATNSLGTATSSVATLSVYAPVTHTQKPEPTNSQSPSPEPTHSSTAPVKAKATISATAKKVKAGKKSTVSVRVRSAKAVTGKVTIRIGSKTIKKNAVLKKGTVTVTVPVSAIRRAKSYRVSIFYSGSSSVLGAKKMIKLIVRK